MTERDSTRLRDAIRTARATGLPTRVLLDTGIEVNIDYPQPTMISPSLTLLAWRDAYETSYRRQRARIVARQGDADG